MSKVERVLENIPTTFAGIMLGGSLVLGTIALNNSSTEYRQAISDYSSGDTFDGNIYSTEANHDANLGNLDTVVALGSGIALGYLSRRKLA
jgi:hypothetical protein